jgi:hypothetical protein
MTSRAIVRIAGVCLMLCFPRLSSADTVVLYENDFESPNVTPAVDCGNSLDTRGIDFLYGTDEVFYNQTNTVEAVFIQDPVALYKNPEGIGGSYAIGMLSTGQDDLLALTFDREGFRFLNVRFDLSPIDVSGCGGPFGVAVPVMQVSLLDSAGGVFNFGQTVLDSVAVTGEAAADQWTFNWTAGVAALDANGATDDHVSVLFDLKQSGYAAFDNIRITASDEDATLDTDGDEVADDLDNCPKTPNGQQEDADEDGVGNVCQCPRGCGDPNGAPGSITSFDALAALRTAVGLDPCKLCICDADDSGAVFANDAMLVLRKAVGLSIVLACPRRDE